VGGVARTYDARILPISLYTICLLPLLCFFSLFLRRPPISTLFPYTTLFRSAKAYLDSRDSGEVVKLEESCTDWVYSNERPSFMCKWKKIEYEYKDHYKTYTCFPGELHFQSIRWADIYRYRITY